jgi:hypothetical protein
MEEDYGLANLVIVDFDRSRVRRPIQQACPH